MKKQALLLFSLLTISTLSAYSQWGSEVGENVQLTSGEGLKLNVMIVPGPDDGWYVSYTTATGGNTHVLHLSKVDSDGNILWDNIIHDLSAVGNTFASMISDMSDGVILAWTDHRVQNDPSIYANRIDPDGNKMWGESDLEVGVSDGAQSCSKMISNGQGGAIITLEDDGPGGNAFSGIYAYGVSSTGVVNWETYLFPDGSTCDNYSITTDGEGGLVAFYIYGHVLEQENQVRGMRLDENGNKLWTDETFDIGPFSQPIGMKFQGSQDSYSFPKIAFHPSAGIYLVYFFNPPGDTAPEHKGQLIDIDGNELWDAEDITLNEPSELSPDVNVLVDLDGNLYFNYHTETDWELQKVLSDGTLPWTIDGVAYSSDQTGGPDNLQITTCNDVMILVDGIDEIIHAIRIDENGDMVYDPALAPLSIHELDDQHRDPVISVNENDKVLAVWIDDEDINDSEWNLKMHGFHKDETPEIANRVLELNSTGFSIYPNPISDAQFIIVETLDIDFGNVTLMDISGRIILDKGKVDFRSGATKISLLNEMKCGMYILQIGYRNQVLSKKLLKY